MKGKGSLALMEELVMLAVFALAAALCLQAFVKSDQMSKQSELEDHALVLCQSVAETIRSEGGVDAAGEKLGADHREAKAFQIGYDKNWDRAGENRAYDLGACTIDTGVPGLGRAGVWVRDEQGGELCRLEISWQEEVTGRG